MSEIANTTPPADDLAAFTAPRPAPGMGVDLAAWVADLQAAHTIGSALCQTEFAPASFRGKPEAAAAAILTGKSLGLDPMNALSNIFVVQGRPALYARTMAALVMQAGHHLRRTAATDESVTVAARRKGDQAWQEFTWDIARAQKAGYTSNKKYASDPQAMLTAKALAEACRTIAPDVLTGIASIAAEEVELEDLGEVPAAPAPQESPKPRTASGRIRQAKAKAKPEPEPVDLADAPEAEPATDPGRDWEVEATNAGGDEQTLRELYNEAQAAGAPSETLNFIRAQVAA
ncbi:hypothetical protein [Arthrobacter woluwensis]|uniref:hypothetical protein n=1 Tax=Arthrobacter woluwensis TaxID=156980 RepID=UPI000D12CBF0|nr:hypothetical protein [Arthrobacter woluwensis]